MCHESIRIVYWLKVVEDGDSFNPSYSIEILFFCSILCRIDICHGASSVVVSVVICKHVSEDILCIFETLWHFCVRAFQSSRERIVSTSSLAINVSDHFIFRRQENFCLVLEANLHNLIGETEHNSVFGLHPFLDIHVRLQVTSRLGRIDLNILFLHLLF